MDTARILVGDDIELQIDAIRKMVKARLSHLLGTVYVPAELEYIVEEVTIARFNMVGSEGLSTHSVEGETQSWADDLFAPYKSDIDLYKSRQRGGPGKVRFL